MEGGKSVATHLFPTSGISLHLWLIIPCCPLSPMRFQFILLSEWVTRQGRNKQ